MSELIQPQQPIHDNLFQFFKNELLTDCIILNKTSAKEYLAHRVVLAAGSKYFYHQLIPPQSDSLTQKDGKFILDLPDKLNSKFEFDDDEAIPILLNYLYSNQNIEAIKTEFTNKNVFQLMALSHSLGVKSLTNCISDYITNKILNEENCGRVFYESIVYDNNTLQQECLNILKKNFHKVSKNLNEFQIILDLPLDIFKKLISDDELVVNSEKEICDIVLNYIKLRKKVEKKEGEGEEKADKPVEKPIENAEEKPKEDAKQEELNVKPEEELNFVEKNKKQLEEMKKHMIKSVLTANDERSLVELIRLSFLTHSELLGISIDEIMLAHKDLVLEGLSMRLNNYEKNQKLDSFKINLKPRVYLDLIGHEQHENSIKNHNDENANNKMNPDFNPIGSYDNFVKNTGGKFSKSLINPNNFDTGMPGMQNQRKSANEFGRNLLENTFNNLGFSTNNMNNMNTMNNMNSYQHNKLSNSNVHAPQKLYKSDINPGKNNNQFSNNLNNNNNLSNNNINNNMEFNYEYDFDENGVFYYLGSLGKSNFYKNPHDIGQIKVFASSLGRGRLADFIGREIVNLRTLNEPFSFFGVDLGEDRTLIPSSYSIWNRNSSSHVMLGWQLEASNDRINFNVIDTRVFVSSDPKINNEMEKERNLLKIPGCTSTWGVDSQVTVNFPNGFRYFILKQIIKNSSGAYNMALSGFELYGRGLGKRWIFR